MRKLWLIIAAYLQAFSLIAATTGAVELRDERGNIFDDVDCSSKGFAFVPNQLLVGFLPSVVNFPRGTVTVEGVECILSAPIRDILRAHGALNVTRVFEMANTDAEAEDSDQSINFCFCIYLLLDADIPAICGSLNELDGVLYAEPNWILESHNTAEHIYSRKIVTTSFPNDTNDPDWSSQWNLHHPNYGIGITDAWAGSPGASAIKLGVVEDGIWDGHADLVVADGRRYYQGSLHVVETNLSGSYREHSTNSAGIPCAITNNGQGIAGVVGGDGSNSGCSLVSVEITGQWNMGVLAKAIQRASGPEVLNCDVLSASWTFECYSETLREAIKYANTQNVNFVCGKGQTAQVPHDRFRSPACLDFSWVTAVGAFGTDGLYCDNDADCGFSSFYGRGIDLLAPGWKCPSTSTIGDDDFIDDYIIYYNGTSAAAPHVAGALALLRSYIGNNLRPEDYENILKLSSRDEQDEGSDGNPLTWHEKYGYGCLNVGNAITAFDEGNIFEYSGAGGSGQAFTGMVQYTFKTGPYAGERNVIAYKVTKHFDFNPEFQTSPKAWGVMRNPLFYTLSGISGANPNFGTPYNCVHDSTVTAYGCDVFTFVYKIYDSSGQNFVGWYPCAPADAPLGCRVLGVPLSGVRRTVARDSVLTCSPNPFNPILSIMFPVDAPKMVRVEIVDARGRRIRTLVDGDEMNGNVLLQWDGRNRLGETVSSGVYFVEVFTGEARTVQKVVLAK